MGRQLPVEKVIELIDNRDIRGLSKGISIIETGGKDRDTLLSYTHSRNTHSAPCFGFTGPAGAGKSTLINCVIRKIRAQEKSVGVIAVDPTSPYTGGAVLGDRARMFEHSTDPEVFIRSLSTRDAMGGICEAAKHALHLFRAFDFDVILIETIGVGQDEVDISKYADLTAVVFAPGFGDIMQASKAGIMEIADIFVVNKADRPGASELQGYLYNTLDFMPEDKRPNIIKTVADQDEGVDRLLAELSDLAANPRRSLKEKQRQRIADEIRSFALTKINRSINRHIDKLVESVLTDSMTAQEASEILLKQVL